MTYDDAKKIILIKPVDPKTDLRIFNVNGYITDTNKITEFDFIVEVFNNPPKFKEPLKDIEVTVES